MNRRIELPRSRWTFTTTIIACVSVVFLMTLPNNDREAQARPNELGDQLVPIIGDDSNLPGGPGGGGSPGCYKPTTIECCDAMDKFGLNELCAHCWFDGDPKECCPTTVSNNATTTWRRTAESGENGTVGGNFIDNMAATCTVQLYECGGPTGCKPKKTEDFNCMKWQAVGEDCSGED